MKKLILPLILISLLIIACKKNNCSNGVLCVQNDTKHMVHYSFGSSLYTDSMAPGQSACADAGKIENKPWGGSSSTINFNSDHGDYYYKVTTCNQKESLK